MQKKPEWLEVVAGVVFSHNDFKEKKVLLVKRKDGNWAIPAGSGGLKDAFEDPSQPRSKVILEGLSDYCWEEAVYDVVDLPAQMRKRLVPFMNMLVPTEEGKVKVFALCKCLLTSGERDALEAASGRHRTYLWFSAEEIEKCKEGIAFNNKAILLNNWHQI